MEWIQLATGVVALVAAIIAAWKAWRASEDSNATREIVNRMSQQQKQAQAVNVFTGPTYVGRPVHVDAMFREPEEQPHDETGPRPDQPQEAG